MKFQWGTSKHTTEQLPYYVAWMQGKKLVTYLYPAFSLVKFEFISRQIHSDQPWHYRIRSFKGARFRFADFASIREEKGEKEWGVILKKKRKDSSKE